MQPTWGESAEAFREKIQAFLANLPMFGDMRREELDRIAKDGEAGEDDVRRAEKELDHLTEQHVHGIDEAMKNKESELLEV